MKNKSFFKPALLTLIFALLLISAGCGGGGKAAPYYSGDSTIPSTGPSSSGTEAFDAAIPPILKRWDIPGATIAVARNGKLILTRAYGYADMDSKQPMQPNATMRIGSCSKSFGGVAIARLYEEGNLDLDAKFLDILTEFTLPVGADQRLRNITVRMLLNHSGGWDRDKSGDPFNDQIKIAQALGIPSPAGCRETTRYMLGIPLDFTPGTKTAYSNLGYCILGLIIEKVSGEPYEIYVRNHILDPIGIHAMYTGTTRRGKQGPYEPKYYDYPGAPTTQSVFSGEGEVPWPYGGLELMDSPGGWIASAQDLVRFVTSLEGSRGPALLTPAAMQEFTANPHLPGMYTDTNFWYGFGVQYYQRGSEVVWSHGGSFPGQQALFVHGRNGYAYAILTNSRGRDPNGLARDMDAVMSAAVNTLDGKGSPTDLFDDFPSPNLPPKTQSH